MERTALLNKKGMTLLEVLIAFSILAIVLTAVLESAIVALRVNTVNALRDEAVNIADQRMNEIRNTAFSSILSNPTETPIASKSRTSSVIFTPTRAVTALDSKTLQVTLSVSWTYMGKPNINSVTSIVRSQ